MPHYSRPHRRATLTPVRYVVTESARLPPSVRRASPSMHTPVGGAPYGLKCRYSVPRRYPDSCVSRRYRLRRLHAFPVFIVCVVVTPIRCCAPSPRNALFFAAGMKRLRRPRVCRRRYRHMKMSSPPPYQSRLHATGVGSSSLLRSVVCRRRMPLPRCYLVIAAYGVLPSAMA